MRIAVLVKQVPETDSVRVEVETGTIIREGVPSILNPFCEYALDEALRLRGAMKEKVEIVAVSMGPPQARSALMRCLELGADRGFLLSDRGFAGSDCWATALALGTFIRKRLGGLDLILTGKQAIDGDTAQVPAEMAEILGIPQVTGGERVDVDGDHVMVTREIEEGVEMVRSPLPALISIGRGSNIRRFPSMKDLMDAREKSLRVITADDLELDTGDLGLMGSRTRVIRVFPPPAREGCRIEDGSDPEVAVDRILDFLEEKGIRTRGRERPC